MRKFGKLIALVLSLLILVPLLVHNADKGGTSSTQELAVPNPPALSEKTPVEAIVTKPDGTVIERQYVYNPNTNTIIIDSDDNEENASLFFPGLELGFLFAGGYWVDQGGYYWAGNRWVYADYPDWDDHWHNYWNHQWNDNHWHNHWESHRGDHQWRGNHPERWNHPGGRPQGEHRAGHGGGHGGGGHR